MSQLSIKEQLMHLKQLTLRLGVIHEAQTVQLRNYPLLIPNIKSAVLDLDAERHIVHYKCTSESGRFRKTKKTKDMISNILIWTRLIIWEDTIIEITVDGKFIYDSRETTASN